MQAANYLITPIKRSFAPDKRQWLSRLPRIEILRRHGSIAHKLAADMENNIVAMGFTFASQIGSELGGAAVMATIGYC